MRNRVDCKFEMTILQGIKPFFFFGICGTTKEAAERLGDLGVSYEIGPSAAKAALNLIGFTRGMNPPSPSVLSSPCEVVP